MWTESWFLKLQGRHRLACVFLRDHASNLGLVRPEDVAKIRNAVGCEIDIDELITLSAGRLQRYGLSIGFVEQVQQSVGRLADLGIVQEDRTHVEDKRLCKTLEQFRLLIVPSIATDWSEYGQQMELVIRELYQRSNAGVSAITVEQWIVKMTSERWTLAELQRAIQSILGNPSKRSFTKSWEDSQPKDTTAGLDANEMAKLERLPSLIAEAPNDRIKQRYEKQYQDLKARA